MGASVTAPPARILLVDSDVDGTAFLAGHLRRAGHLVSTMVEPKAALAALDRAWPDLIVMELDLPGIGGRELARRIKRRADIPIIVLSAIATRSDKVDMLSRYAEDYVTKPYDTDELEARIGRVIRRTGQGRNGSDVILGPDLSLAFRRRRALVGANIVALSGIETRFLAILADQLGATVTTADLLASVWAGSANAEPAYVWVLVRRLRRKIELDPDRPTYLLTDTRGGYRLVERTARGT